MSDRVAIEQWPQRLHAFVKTLPWPPNEPLDSNNQLTVLRETDSTQDAARRLNATAGAIVVAGRQTSGRGRLGRTWADTCDQGVAVTLVIAREKPERLAIVSAIAAAMAAEQFLTQQVSIKWPNDIFVNGRKLAGILIEQTESLALVGMGMNVRQHQWAEELTGRAVSLAQLNVHPDRIDVIEAIIGGFASAIPMSDSELEKAFAARDVLRGNRVSFRCGHETVTGKVLNIDPLRGLRVRDEYGEKWLPAAVTSVLNADAALS
jgi:BirA family transcriptional regulator, biotin operon repressor / biotin---[acetyl-CoA-carboxylase] ligase